MREYQTLEEKRKFLQTKEICSLSELKKFIDCVSSNNNLVFRGVKEAKYMNYTSAQVKTGAALDQATFTKLVDEAISCVKQSPTIMSILRARSRDETDFQILSLMQHYGCGTPILDYSNSINAALFFAIDRQEGDSQTVSEKDQGVEAFISIYYFDKTDPNHCSVQEFTQRDSEKAKEYDAIASKEYGSQYKGFSQQTMESFLYLPYNELAKLDNGGLFSVLGYTDGIISYQLGGENIEYSITNERLIQQEGLFLFNGLSNIPYEEAAYNWYPGIQNYCVNIHKSLEKDIKAFLKKRGITHSTIYPETEESKAIINELRLLPFDGRLKP
jgi:hypothetical protein